MNRYDRDEVLGRTDLTALADELCGPSRGRGAGAKWHCPNPDHPDAHPSMTVFQGQRSQRWKCHACGDGGTAIDLWMTVRQCSVGEAIEALGSRVHAPRGHEAWGGRGPAAPSRRDRGATNEARRAAPAARALTAPDPAIEEYVASAAEFLWGPQGEPGREWLGRRGFSDEVLRANRVGYDPGRRAFRRAKGLPYRAAGIVFPVLGPDDRAVYLQIRYLDPVKAGRDKYDNCWSGLAVNPRVAVLRTPSPNSALAGVIVVGEGIPDGLVGSEVGAPAAAIIGAGNYGADVPLRLSEAFPDGRFILPWDADMGGRKGKSVLGAHLVELGRHVLLSAPGVGYKDLNELWVADREGLAAEVLSYPLPMLYQPPDAAVMPGVQLRPLTPRSLGMSLSDR